MTLEQTEKRKQRVRAAAARQRERDASWNKYRPDLLRTPPKSIEETIIKFKPMADAARDEKVAKFKGS